MTQTNTGAYAPETILEDPFGGDEPGQQEGEEPQLPLETATPTAIQEVSYEMVETHIEIQNLETRVKELKARYVQLENVALQHFAQMQITKMTVKSGQTLHIRKDTRASLVKDDAGSLDGAHNAMRATGLGWMVDDKVNANTLSAWVREQRNQEQEIPENLLPFLKISEVFRVRVWK